MSPICREFVSLEAQHHSSELESDLAGFPGHVLVLQLCQTVVELVRQGSGVCVGTGLKARMGAVPCDRYSCTDKLGGI